MQHSTTFRKKIPIHKNIMSNNIMSNMEEQIQEQQHTQLNFNNKINSVKL